MKLYYNLIACFLFITSSATQAQTLQRLRNTPAGVVYDAAYSERYGLFVAGQFEGVGTNVGSVSLFTDSSDTSDPSFPRFYDTVQDIISDDNGGWYVAGDHFRAINENDSTAYDKWGIVHVLSNNQIDPNFTLNISNLFPTVDSRIGVIKLLKKGGTLYAIGDVRDSWGTLQTSIFAVNATTGTGLAFPRIKGIVGANEYGNVLYLKGGAGVLRDSADTPFTPNLIAIDLRTKQRKNWNPTFDTNRATLANAVVLCAGGKVIVDYVIEGSTLGSYTHIGIAAFDTTNAASIPASWTYQVPYAHSVAISAQGIFVHNQSVYLPVWTNNDTYVLHAFNVANGTPISGWNPNTFTFQSDNGGFVYRAAVTKTAVVGNRVYLYGLFNQVNGIARRNWAAIDLATNQLTNWDLQAMSVVTNPNVLYAHQNKLFCMARSDTWYKYTTRPNLVLLNPVTQEVIPKTFPFLPNATTNTWQINKIATIDNTLWVTQAGLQAPNESIGAYDIPTGDKLNQGTFRFLYQGYLSQGFTKLIPVDTVLYTLGVYESVNGQSRPSGMAAISVNGSVLPFTLNADLRSITDFAVVGDLLYLAGTFTQINGVARRYLASVNRFTGQLTNWNPDPAQPITTFLINGNNVFISGNQARIGAYTNPRPNLFTNFLIDRITGSVVYAYGNGEIAETSVSKERYTFLGWQPGTDAACATMTYFDTERKKYASQCFIKKPRWFTSRVMTFAGNRLFFYPGPLSGQSSRQSLMQVSFPSTFFNNQIDYFPKIGSNGGSVTVNFYGYNLSAGTKVRLLKNGQTPITVPDSLLSYPDNFRVQAVMELRDKVVGDWDIELILPNYQKIVIPNGFKIKQATPPDMHIRVIAPGFTRPGRPTKITIAISNRGEGDAYLVPFWIDMPANTKMKFPILNYKDTIFVEKDTIFTISIISRGHGPGQRGWIAVPRVGGGEVAQVPMVFTPPSSQGNAPFNLCSQMGDPLSFDPFQYGHSTLFPDVKQCLDPILGVAGDIAGIVVPEAGSVLGFFDKMDKLDKAIKTKNIPYLDIGGSLVQGALDHLPDDGSNPYIYMKKFGDGLSQALGFLPIIGNALEIPSSCEKLKPKPKKEDCASVPIVTSQDPNDKIGPMGVHAQRYITDKDPLSYQIRFENYPTATAAAQLVQVLDTLDRTKFDFSTFQFGHFNIADTNFYAPPGRKSFLRDWDLRPTKELIVRMEANFNDSTGILKATYTALDPATMELTEDAILGFLPPNQTAPEGEGSLFFSINAKPDLPHAATITNRASIVFDYNAPIPTPAWTNTLDKILPQSSIQPLPSISSDTTLTLRWDGSDTGAGVKLYDVYVSVNGGTYKPVITNTELTEVSYIGKADSTYRFYSVAIDSVGNEEPISINFDTQTTISFNGIRSLASGNWNNPATWSCNCVPGAQDVITIMDGHRVEVPDSQSVRFKKLIVKHNASLYYKRE